MSGRHRASRRARRIRARRRARVRRLTASSSAALLTVAGLTAVDKLPLLERIDDDGPATDEFAAVPPSGPTSAGAGMARAKHAHAARASDRASPQPSVEVTLNPGKDVKPPAVNPLPADSGAGKRIVYDLSGQQVWLVDEDDTVVRTYLVSGSLYDQLDPGRYEVFSKSRNAISWTGESTMEYMVRFYRSVNSNIGFHDIPVSADTGEEVQTLSELGTPLSDGCIRQDESDAEALYEFASVGTPVIVVST